MRNTSLAFVLGFVVYIKAELALYVFLRKPQKATIYNSGPPRNSSLSTKVKRFAFKACLRCMDGDFSAVVRRASRRP